MIPGPYLLFLGNKKLAKVAQGSTYWRPTTRQGLPLDLRLPDMTVAEVEDRMGLSVVDPVRQGAGRLVDALR